MKFQLLSPGGGGQIREKSSSMNNFLMTNNQNNSNQLYEFPASGSLNNNCKSVSHLPKLNSENSFLNVGDIQQQQPPQQSSNAEISNRKKSNSSIQSKLHDKSMKNIASSNL